MIEVGLRTMVFAGSYEVLRCVYEAINNGKIYLVLYPRSHPQYIGEHPN